MRRSSFVLALFLLLGVAACTRDPKEVARKYVETGNKYFDKGKYKEASIMYRRALQKNMRDAQAHYRLGLVELHDGMVPEARRSFLRATDLDPKNNAALAKLGDIDLAVFMSDRIQYKSFLTDLKDVDKKLLANDPKSYDGLRLAGFVAIGNNDLPGAIAKFKEANSVKPNQPELIYSLVRVLYADKQPEEAERIAKDLISKHKDFGPIYDQLYMVYATTNRPADAEEILKEKVANNPKLSQPLIELAFHYFLTKRPADMNATLAKLTSNPGAFPQGHLQAGDFLLRTGDFDRAVQQYQQGEKADAKNKPAYQKREVEALSRQGKNGEASQIVAQLVKENPKDPETVAMHASMMIQTKDPKQVQKAIDELQPLVASTPSNQKGALQLLHFNLARAYMAKGDSTSQEQARLQLQETLKLNPQFIPAKMALAEVLLARGENPKAVQTADEIISREPNSLPAHLIRTMGLMNMGETDRSRQELQAILAANPKSNDARYQVAILDFSQKKLKEAEANFDILDKAGDPRGFLGLVNTRSAQGDYDGAIRMVQAQLSKNPDRLDYRRLLAETEVRAKKYDSAIGEYQSMLQKDPSAYNYIRLGEVQRDAGKLDDAIASFQKAKQLKPTDPFPVLEMAVLYDAVGRMDEARKGYEEVLKLQPDNDVALNNLAYSKADQGVDLDQALTYAERARQKLPDNPNVADTIGLIYLRKNLVDESIRVLSDLVSRQPKIATYHLHYAMALYQKGEKTAAKKELEEATHDGPNDKEKMRIQELRQKLT